MAYLKTTYDVISIEKAQGRLLFLICQIKAKMKMLAVVPLYIVALCVMGSGNEVV